MVLLKCDIPCRNKMCNLGCLVTPVYSLCKVFSKEHSIGFTMPSWVCMSRESRLLDDPCLMKLFQNIESITGGNCLKCISIPY